MGRARHDYTYVPASKVAQKCSSPVGVNGLLNRVLGIAGTVGGSSVMSVCQAVHAFDARVDSPHRVDGA